MIVNIGSKPLTKKRLQLQMLGDALATILFLGLMPFLFASLNQRFANIVSPVWSLDHSSELTTINLIIILGFGLITLLIFLILLVSGMSKLNSIYIDTSRNLTDVEYIKLNGFIQENERIKAYVSGISALNRKIYPSEFFAMERWVNSTDLSEKHDLAMKIKAELLGAK